MAHSQAESQADPKSTQQPDPSPSTPVGSLPSEQPPQVRDRASQQAAHDAIDKRNPLSPANREAKRQAMLAKLREDRNVPEPKRAQPPEPTGTDSGHRDAGGGDPQPAGEPGDVSARQGVEPPAAISAEQAQWMQQQQVLREAEQRAREATSAIEKRKAEAEAAEARAAEKIKKMELAMSNPAEFMSEAGMTQDEWNAFWANGGKLSPEQKRMREMEAKMTQYAEKLAAIERQAQAERAHSQRRLEDAEFTATLKDYTFLPEVGGIGAVRNKQQQLSTQQNKSVTLKEAADALEREVQEGLNGMLKKSHILAKLGLATASNQPPAAPTKTPKTLTARTASDSSPKAVTVKGPLDWAGKRARYLERLASDRAAARDR
jgi:hypothetical protein